MVTFVRDLRYGIRVLVHEPGFSVLAILALALGIGATTAIFTVVDSVLLRPLPYKDPARLVVALHGPEATGPVSPADYLDFQREARSFQRLGAARAWSGTLGSGERPEIVPGLRVTAELFELLGVPALVGRTFVEGDDRPGHDQILVLSYGLWQRRFGGDRSIVGREIAIDNRPYVVVGVMPPSFRFAPFWQTRAEMWTPLALASQLTDRSGRSLRLFARLKDDVTVAQAQSELSAIAARLERTYPQTNAGIGITVRPLLDKVVSGIRPTLVALMAMVMFVLLIACANVANTLLARASGRQKEIGLRIAIGASQGRLIRQMLTESVLLATAGALIGVLFAFWGINWLLAMLPPASLPRQQEVTFDVRVFALTALATLVTGIVTGLIPALQLLRGSVVQSFQDGGKGSTETAGRKRLRGLLVSVEVTLALVLLVGAGLMARTMMKLGHVDPGFRVDQLAVATVSLAGTPHVQATARHPMFLRIRERLATLPGVTSISAINHLPLAGDIWNLGYTIEGKSRPAPGQGWSAVYRVVQPGYFSTMELPLLSGRDFSSADVAASSPVAIVNRAMADRRWPGESPVGRRIFLPGPANVQAPITIVGVAANARQSDWTSAPSDEVYLPFAQRSAEFGLTAMTFLLRSTADPHAVAAVIPGEVALLDRGVAVSDNTTMAAVVAAELWRERLTAQLTGVFAIVALGLAAIGVYAVVSYSVARRTREFGVRVALGATRGNVVRLALTEALGPVLVGSVLGFAAALAASRMMQAFLFEVSAIDPLALGGAMLALALVAAVAAWLPARHASRLDPVAALRRE
jgi:putative ABC transport system permease protein